MGFLDKAKQKFKAVPKSLGEETVKIVDYDELPVEKVKTPKAVTPQETHFAAEELEPILAPEVEHNSGTGSKLNIFSKKKKNGALESAMKEISNSDGAVIKDILELLNIPETFEIDASVFLPEDINGIGFDLQAPTGFDQGQVNAFKEQVYMTLVYLVKLLRMRNEHVAKLATAIDRLQTDIQNQKFEAEISNGINIMPTENDSDLVNQAFEDRLLIRKLTEELERLQNGDELTDSEREAYEQTRDDLSIALRENEEKDELILRLRSQIAYNEESEDDYTRDPHEEGDFKFEEDDEIAPVDNFGGLDLSDSLPEGIGLPDLGDDSEELPTYNDDEPSQFAQAARSSSAFYTDDDEDRIDTFMENNSNAYEGSVETNNSESFIEYMDDDEPPAVNNSQNSIRYDEDEDDPLAAIMREEWGKDR